MIGNIGFQLARTDDARIGVVRIFVEDVLKTRQDSVHVVGGDVGVVAHQAAVDVNVRPGPQLDRDAAATRRSL